MAQTALYLVIVGVLFAPVFFLARRRGLTSTIRAFALAGVIVIALCVGVELSSDRLIDQCLEAGNRQCYDGGSSGMQALFAGGYGVVAVIRSYFLWKD